MSTLRFKKNINVCVFLGFLLFLGLMPTKLFSQSASLPTDRARVTVAQITDPTDATKKLKVLRTDANTPLRGASPWIRDKNKQVNDGDFSSAFFAKHAAENLNSIRLIWFQAWFDNYAIQQGTAPNPYEITDFNNPTQVQHCLNVIEAAVNNASANGMYTCINFHSAWQGPINLDYAKKFWNVVAPYFKNRTNVIYEFSNEPVPGSNTFAPGNDRGNDMNAQVELYNICRTAAPETFILIFSPPSIEGTFTYNPFIDGVKLFESRVGTVDWSKTGVGYHTYYMGWDGANNKKWESSEPIRALHRAYPGMPTEISWPAGVVNELNTATSMDGELFQIQTLERLGVGWWLWAVSNPDPTSMEGWYRNWPKAKADAVAKGYFWAKDGNSLPVDGEKPTKPTHVVASSITTNSVQLTWTASTDNVGVSSYEIYNGATYLNSTSTTSIKLENLTSGTSYSLTVKAKDTAGNSSDASVAVSFTTLAYDVIIPNTSVAPVIDGTKEAAWKGTTSSFANVTVGSVGNSADLSGNWTAMWDNTNLYIFGSITDANISVESGTAWYDDDRLEIFIDAAFSRSTTYGAKQYQYYVRPGENTIKEIKLNAVANTQVAYTSVTGGYNFEIKIPFATLGITPILNLKMGIDVQVGDDDDGGGVDGKLAWYATNDNSWQNPSLFGIAKLGSETSTGINDNLLSEVISIYPNPATNKFAISNVPANSTVSIMAVDGRILATNKQVTSTIEYEVSSWNKGLYLIKIQKDNTVFMKKIVVN